MYSKRNMRRAWCLVASDRMIEWKPVLLHFVLSDAIQNDGLSQFISRDRRSELADR